MSEGIAAGSDAVTAGMLLRQAREAAGLHAATLAATLKVPLRKLEALEADRYEELPDAVFVRALASSICRTLKVDVQPVLERLPQTAQPRLVQDNEGINAPFRAPGMPKPGWSEQVSRPVVLTVVALLLAALVLTFLPQVQREESASPATPATATEPVMPPGTPATVTAAPAEPREPDAAPAAGTTPAAAASAAPATAAAPAAPLVLAPAASIPPAAAPSASAAASSAAAPAFAGTGVVSFRTSGSSWIQVTDARGTTVLQRLMGAGETAAVNGALPLAVTVGNTGATEVQVRGKPFNLQSVARDNVARFEVN
jgi:cytoskeleton protein RodZ